MQGKRQESEDRRRKWGAMSAFFHEGLFGGLGVRHSKSYFLALTHTTPHLAEQVRRILGRRVHFR